MSLFTLSLFFNILSNVEQFFWDTLYKNSLWTNTWAGITLNVRITWTTLTDNQNPGQENSNENNQPCHCSPLKGPHSSRHHQQVGVSFHHVVDSKDSMHVVKMDWIGFILPMADDWGQQGCNCPPPPNIEKRS